LFCSGEETCNAGTCESGTPPCDPVTQTCNEEADECEGLEKVTICHIPPGNPDKAKTLSIGAGSVADHLAHGDTLGQCQ
jgi:hypothetical protein